MSSVGIIIEKLHVYVNAYISVPETVLSSTGPVRRIIPGVQYHVHAVQWQVHVLRRS